MGVLSALILPLIVHPILFGLYAKQRHHRPGLLWAIIALAIDIAMVFLCTYDLHTPATVTNTFLITDCSATIGTIIPLLILYFGKDLPFDVIENFGTRLRRGVFRLWVFFSATWVLFFTVRYYLNCELVYGGRIFCRFSGVRHYYAVTYESPFDIGTWFVSGPLLGFMCGVAACWVIEGFIRPGARDQADTALLLTEKVDEPAAPET